ncbi:serine 3-dehydrogenase [Aspergillus udagawae]|nr:serine 3-dehydrogenase [Aspergillus udagawae]
MNVSDKLSFISTLHRAPYPAIDPRTPSSSAARKTILITGGATGIGFAVARNFALAGASTIVLLARREETLKNAASELSAAFPDTQFLTYAGSVTDDAEIQKVFSSVRRTALNKDVDVLVMCAAFIKASKPLSMTPLSEVKTTFETNVFGNLNVVNAFLDAPKKEGKVIVDFTSYASYMPFPQTGPYGASKAAFSFLMRHVQNEHPELRVYTLHPGAVWTQAAAAAGMTKDMLDWDDEDLPGQFVVWLAGQEAAFLKGRFLASHWDVTELMAKKETFELDADLSTIGLRR